MRFREVTERFRLEKILRSTRTGTVLRAVDAQSGQTVAVKMITVGPSPGFAEGAPKFQALVGALAAVPHPGLPPVLDSGFTPDGSAFLVFPYLDGRSFEALAGGPPAQVLPLLLQTFDALEALAAHGVAHHNVTPDNLWVVDTPAGPQVKLLGVGTAIFQVPDGPNARFRAPELPSAAAAATADSRADLYSFALTACKGLGATESLGDGSNPVVQMPFALSFELENAEGIRQVLELCLRPDPAQRPAPAVIREAFRPALAALAPGGGADSWQDAEPAWQEKTKPLLFPDLDMTLSPPMLEVAPDPVPQAVPPAAPPAVAPVPRPAAAPAPAPALAETPVPANPAPAPLPATPGAPALPDLPDLSALPVTPPPAVQPAAAAPRPAAPIPPLPPLTPAPTTPPRAPVTASPVSPANPVAPPPPSPLLGVPAGAATAAPSAQPAPEPDPLPDGDLFPEITDDILNALPEDWQPGDATASPARVLPFGKGKPAPEPEEAPAEGAPAPAAARKPALLLLGGAGLVVLLLVAAGIWFATRPAEEPAAGGTAAAAAGAPETPAAPPRRPAALRLEEARQLIAEGNDFGAREILRGFTAADQAALTPAQCEALSRLEQLLALSAGDRLPDDLKAGLGGDLVRLRSAVATANDLPDIPEALRADLVKAVQAADLYTQAQEAARNQQTVAVLERLASLDGMIPGFRDPQGLRDQAAAALESEARALAVQGKYEPAVAYLKPIQDTWPDRPGFADLIASYQRAQQDEQSQKSLLEKLVAIERRRKPHEGLEAMEGIEPVPSLAAQYADMRRRLEAQLAQIDGQPPKVVLRDGFYLEYSRGTVANLSFRVTDDYEVRSVKMMAKPEGGKMREVPLKKSTFGYDAEIPTSLHQNGTLEFYVVATDRSGHEGYYGSASQPAQLKRVGGERRF